MRLSYPRCEMNKPSMKGTRRYIEKHTYPMDPEKGPVAFHASFSKKPAVVPKRLAFRMNLRLVDSSRVKN